MTNDTVEDIVRAYVPLVYGVSPKGWHSVYCEVCGDGKRTKGPRGGWLFHDEMCFYNCFNCGVEGNFDPSREHPMSRDMYKIFTSFDIPYKDVQEIVVQHLKDNKNYQKPVERIVLPNLDHPDYFIKLEEQPEDDLLAMEARDFLWERYKITDQDYPFFLSSGKTKSNDPDDQYRAKYLRPRIIIPIYQNERLIYWTARIFVGESNRKYIDASVQNSSAVVHGLDYLYADNKDRPLYITEGFFDAWHVKGLAVFGNTMKDPQIKVISRSYRPKIVIPDYNHDGMQLANQAIELGWGISLPDILPHKDICAAINEYGKLYVLKTIAQSTYYNFEAKIRLKEFRLRNKKILSNQL